MKFFLFILLLVLSSCVSDKQLGDREFSLTNYKKALEFYELEMSADTQDPEVFAQAARASVQLGSFGTAERFYGKAVAKGAGIEVVRELAKFYVRTSNYGSAIRVYKYLLNLEEDKQPVYNNLGTAYLYSGSPFDAESYLLIAQQLRPSDPFPYLNLGLLYDQNLKKRSRAIGFYKCFLELAPRHNSRASVSQRLDEMLAKSKTEETIDCTIPYREPSRHVSIEDFRQKMKEIDGAATNEKAVQKVKIENINNALATSFSNPNTLTKAASLLYLKEDFKGAEAEFEKLPFKAFDADSALAYGDTLTRLFKFSEAVTWLQISERSRPTPNAVKLLINALRNTNRTSEIELWCEKYKIQSQYKEATRQCPISLEKDAVKTDEKQTLPESKTKPTNPVKKESKAGDPK